VVREAETILPDHDADQRPSAEIYNRLQELLEARQRLILAPATLERERALKQLSIELRQLGRQNH
jgi:hypothetical protein